MNNPPPQAQIKRPGPIKISLQQNPKPGYPSFLSSPQQKTEQPNPLSRNLRPSPTKNVIISLPFSLSKYQSLSHAIDFKEKNIPYLATSILQEEIMKFCQSKGIYITEDAIKTIYNVAMNQIIELFKRSVQVQQYRTNLYVNPPLFSITTSIPEHVSNKFIFREVFTWNSINSSILKDQLKSLEDDYGYKPIFITGEHQKDIFNLKFPEGTIEAWEDANQRLELFKNLKKKINVFSKVCPKTIENYKSQLEERIEQEKKNLNQLKSTKRAGPPYIDSLIGTQEENERRSKSTLLPSDIQYCLRNFDMFSV